VATCPLTPIVHRVPRWSPTELSAKEFAVLECLLSSKEVWSCRRVTQRGWDEFVDPYTTTVKTTIRRLRIKLGDPPIIHTVREGGYRIGRTMKKPREKIMLLFLTSRHPLRVQLTALYAGLSSLWSPQCSSFGPPVNHGVQEAPGTSIGSHRLVTIHNFDALPAIVG